MPVPVCRLAFLLIGVLLITGCQREAKPTAAAPATPEPIVILVGIDALQPSQLAALRPPNLSRMAAEGVHAERMIPSFPTLTFPNFYTLVTGLRPQNHGIIGNSMFDPGFGASFSLGSPAVTDGRWWGGEPLWITAQKQGLRAACMFWPGSEAEIGGMRPWDWKPYDGDVTPEARVQTVLDWLALPAPDRPRFITLYFHHVDTAGHRFGPVSEEAAAAVRMVDNALGGLLAGVERLGLSEQVNVIVVSDHGMAEVSPDRVIVISELADPKAVQVDFAGATAGLRPLRGSVEDLHATISTKAQNFRVYRREEIPERLHFRNHDRIPPLVLVADEGWLLIKRPLLENGARNSFQRATHGFDPELPSMSATFIAWGPAFRRGVTLPAFENVQIYNLVCATLGLKAAPNDGDARLAEQVLVSPAEFRSR